MIMTTEERKSNIDAIHNMIPECIFTNFCEILTQIEDEDNSKDLLIQALGRICRKESHSFAYLMKSEDNENTITPIREILDLLDGWLVSSKVVSTVPRTHWAIDSIVE